MKKIDLGQSVTILANVGIVSLLFELRQNTQAIELASMQDFWMENRSSFTPAFNEEIKTVFHGEGIE